MDVDSSSPVLNTGDELSTSMTTSSSSLLIETTRALLGGVVDFGLVVLLD